MAFITKDEHDVLMLMLNCSLALLYL